MINILTQKRGDSKTWIGSLHPTLGPSAEANTGDGSYGALFSTPWMGLWNRSSGLLEHYRAVAGAWQLQVPLQAFPALPLTARHTSYAFDSSARPVWAWENFGEIYVWQFDPGSSTYVLRGPFAGSDPVLVQDTLVHYTPYISDVRLYHLSTDRLSLICRVQREQYSIPALLDSFGQPAVLDYAPLRPYQVQLAGVFDSYSSLLGDLEPVAISLALAGQGGFSGGQVVNLTQLANVGIGLLGNGGFASGQVVNLTQLANVGVGLLGNGGFASGALQNILVNQSVSVGLVANGGFSSGSNATIGVPKSVTVGLLGSGGFSSGTLA